MLGGVRVSAWVSFSIVAYKLSGVCIDDHMICLLALQSSAVQHYLCSKRKQYRHFKMK